MRCQRHDLALAPNGTCILCRDELKAQLSALRRHVTESEVRLATARNELAATVQDLSG